MARLIPQGQGGLTQPLELRLGINRIGRGPHNDFSIDHSTVSALHLEAELTGEGLMVRDLGSTNGTFLNGEPIQTAQVCAGQFLRLGSVELLVELADVRVIIPERLPPVPPPVLKKPNAPSPNMCLHHDTRQAVWKCTRCTHLYCTPCIHRLRRRGGKTLYLCPDCSGICEVLPEFVKKDKRTWFGFVKDKLDVTRLLPSRRKKTE